MLKSTVSTLKFLPMPIRLFLIGFGVDMSAPRATFRGVSGWDEYHPDTSYYRFVGNKNPELVESPIVRSTPLGFVSRLLIQALSNVSQILKSQCCIKLFCLSNKLLADVVIQPFLISSFSALKPSRQATCRTSAFAASRRSRAHLNIRSSFAIPVSSCLNVFTTPSFASRGSSDVCSTEIDSNYFGSFTRWGSIYLHNNVNKVITLPSLVECGTSWSLTTQQCNLIPTNFQRQVNATTYQSYTSDLIRFIVLKCPSIQTNRSWSKFVNLFNCFGVTNYSPNSLTNMVRFQSCRKPHWMVNKVMQLSYIPTFSLFCCCQDLVTSIRKSIKCTVNFSPQLLMDYQLAFYRYGLSHGLIVTHPR